MPVKPAKLTVTEASGGVKPHIVRYMLIVSTLVAIVALMTIVFWFGYTPV
jgi:flagellar basal body-associated protein FliL